MSTRNVRSFVHLRAHSTYSLGVGLSTPSEICHHARRTGYDAIALTDINGTYGFVEFHRAARAVGVKPIYGTLLLLDWDSSLDTPRPEHTLVVLALDRAGLRNVCATASVSAIRRERGEAFFVTDLEGRADGVVALFGLRQYGREAVTETTRHMLTSMRSLFGDRLFVECRGELSGDAAAAQSDLLGLAGEQRIHPVLTQDVRFVGPEKHQLIDLIGSADDTAHEHAVYSEAAGSVGHGYGLSSPGTMSESYERFPEAYTNASLIAALVQRDILDSVGTSDRPAPTGDMFSQGEEMATVFRKRVQTVFDDRFSGATVARRRAAAKRLENEVVLIVGAGLEGTFLEFHEIVGRLRRAGVTLGPSTGLRLQSLTAWLLGITTFNPYDVDENFHPRFVADGVDNRILDLQVPLESRGTVVTTLGQLFDGSGIGYVPSVEHITAARALRMVAKRLEIDPGELDDVIRIATDHPGVSLKELCEENRAIGAMVRRSAALRELIAHAASIEGLPFGFVRSKRSVIVSPYPIRHFLGHTVNPQTGDHFVQSTRDSFPIGAIRRVDIATLSALSLVDTLESSSAHWDTAEDAGIYACIADKETDGVYILESPFAQRLAADFGIDSFGDLVNFLALMRFRRGDLSFANRVKAFRTRATPADEEKPTDAFVSDTNGWLLFDDQLRNVIVTLTGLDPAAAWELARRFRFHDPGNLASLRREFFSYTAERGVELEEATQWFSRILRSADRVVDRQRIVADALLVRKVLDLKSRQWLEFFVGLVNHATDTRKRSGYLATLQNEGRMLRPDVNRSQREFAVENGNVRPPLSALDGVSERTAERIVGARGEKQFRSADSFRRAIAELEIPADEIDALVRSGALESAGVPAEGEIQVTEPKPAPEATPAATQGQLSFHLSEGPDAAAPTGAPPAPTGESNPRASFRVVGELSEFYTVPDVTPVELSGQVRDFHRFASDSGKDVGFFVLFDDTASVQVFAPWERIATNGDPLSDGVRVRVRGKVRARTGKKTCAAVEVVGLDA